MSFTRLIAFAFALMVGAANPCLAQTGPANRSAIAVFPPGGSLDQVAWIIVQLLSKQLARVSSSRMSVALRVDRHQRSRQSGARWLYVRRRLRYAWHECEPDSEHRIRHAEGPEHVTLIGTSPMALVASANRRTRRWPT